MGKIVQQKKKGDFSLMWDDYGSQGLRPDV